MLLVKFNFKMIVSFISEIDDIRNIIEAGLFLRKESNLKVRQPLKVLQIKNNKNLNQDLFYLIKEELNIKEIEIVDSLSEDKGWIIKDNISLDTRLNDELKKEGIIRELTRQINTLRKNAHLTPEDRITLFIQSNGALIKQAIEDFKDSLSTQTLSNEIIWEEKELEFSKEINVYDENVWFGVERI